MAYLFKWKGEIFPVEFQKIGTQLWVYHQGQVFVHPAQAQIQKNRKNSEEAATGIILAPMPGKITKILKKNLDMVNKGDSLIVMEAMKMEYTLKAEVNGQVEQLLCQVGDQVVLGKKLAQIKRVG